jgi:hypothetical protein
LEPPLPIRFTDADLAAAQATFLEEILVTKQRREERLQDVPIALSVFTGEQLERLLIDDVSELQYAAPNLTITPYPGSASRVNIAMRGQLEPEIFPTLIRPLASISMVCISQGSAAPISMRFHRSRWFRPPGATRKIAWKTM